MNQQTLDRRRWRERAERELFSSCARAADVVGRERAELLRQAEAAQITLDRDKRGAA